MRFEHRAEWEWGWKTPLLLRFQAPDAIADFLAAPLTELSLSEAEEGFARRIADLRSTRIGMRFERVQEALFRSHPGTASLRTGLIIPGRTEIDLLQRLHSLPDTVVHWEVAVKFYLGLDEGGSDDPDRYVGPSLKDTLGKKMRTIYDRQLAVLADSEVRRKYGADFGIRDDDAVLALPKVHGILFHPFLGQTETRRPSSVSDAGLRGAWFEIDRIGDFAADLAARAAPGPIRVRWLVDRREWIRDQSLTAVPADDEIDLKEWLKSGLASRLESHFSAGGEPIQGAIVRDGPEGKSESRFFIVPKGWHRAARESRIEA